MVRNPGTISGSGGLVVAVGWGSARFHACLGLAIDPHFEPPHPGAVVLPGDARSQGGRRGHHWLG